MKQKLRISSRELKSLYDYWHTKHITVMVLFIFTLSLSAIQAQEAITATGGKASGGGASVTYSIGQVVYTTNTGTNGFSVAQGVQQPYEISVVTSVGQTKGINLECWAYPNPVTDILRLKVEREKIEGLSFQLFDINGKMIVSKKLTAKETTINMGNLLPATYYLKVTDNKREIKIFKIIKN